MKSSWMRDGSGRAFGSTGGFYRPLCSLANMRFWRRELFLVESVPDIHCLQQWWSLSDPAMQEERRACVAS